MRVELSTRGLAPPEAVRVALNDAKMMFSRARLVGWDSRHDGEWLVDVQMEVP